MDDLGATTLTARAALLAENVQKNNALLKALGHADRPPQPPPSLFSRIKTWAGYKFLVAAGWCGVQPGCDFDYYDDDDV